MTILLLAQANALAAIQAQIAALNTGLKANYLSAFADWLVSWTAARITDKSTAPKPPNGFVVGYFADPTTGPGMLGPYGDTVIQWPYPAVGTEPVCGQPPIPDLSAKTVGSDDTVPAGFIVTAPDGSKWQKVSSPSPFGMVTYYTKVV